jgi:hypothetical protein
MTSAQRIFQGIRKGFTSGTAGYHYSQHTNKADDSVLLRELGFAQRTAERVELSLKGQSIIDLTHLSDDFRKHWKLVFLSVQSSSSEEPRVYNIPFYAETAAALGIEGLTSEIEHKTRPYYDGNYGRHINIREDCIYCIFRSKNDGYGFYLIRSFQRSLDNVGSADRSPSFLSVADKRQQSGIYLPFRRHNLALRSMGKQGEAYRGVCLLYLHVFWRF